MSQNNDYILTVPEIITRIPLQFPCPLVEASKMINTPPPSTIITREIKMLEGQTTKTTPRGGRQQLHIETSSTTPVIDFYGISMPADPPLEQESMADYIRRIGAPAVEKQVIWQDLERDELAAIEASRVAGNILYHDPGDGVFIGYTEAQRLAYLDERIRLMTANGGLVPDTIICGNGFEAYLTGLLNYTASYSSGSLSFEITRSYPRVARLLNNLKIEYVSSYTGNVGKNRALSSPSTEIGYDCILLSSANAPKESPNDNSTNPVPALTTYVFGLDQGFVPVGLNGKRGNFETEAYGCVHVTDPRSIYVIKECFKPKS